MAAYWRKAVSENSVPSTARVSAETQPVLAIDFGTSNTYLTKCPGDKEDPVGADFGDGRDGIATAILYRDGKEPLIGHVALEEFEDAGTEHEDYRFRAQLKPDLVSNPEARIDARDFLVDFGGGTCDFALVVRGEILHSWGDIHLGGRLFDDLFYQWFIEQNPEAIAAMRRERAKFFVLAVRCREVKEKFSLAMALDPTTVYRKTLGEYGHRKDVTWDSFLARAPLPAIGDLFSVSARDESTGRRASGCLPARTRPAGLVSPDPAPGAGP
jgi:hypothetical protein